MRKQIIIFLCFIVITSGCLTQKTVLKNGVLIEEFDASPSQVYATEPVQLRLKIRNSGSVEAKNIRFEIFGIDEREWLCTTDCQTLESLLPPDKESNTEGQTKICLWNCKAASLKSTYKPGIRIWYDYKTDVVRSLTIVSHDEIQRLQDKNMPLPSEIVSSTSSPISIDIEIKTPLRYWKERNEITFPIAFKIENVGDGVSCTGGCEERNWNKIYLIIKSDIELLDCELKTNANNEIQLWEGKHRTITCTAKIREKTDIQLKKTINVMAEYTYFTDKFTTIQVI